MKLSFFLVLVATLQLSAETYGQRVRLKYDGAELATVLRDIQRATGYNLAGKYDLVKKAKLVTINKDSVDLMEALRMLEKGQALELRLQGRNILVNDRVLDSVITNLISIDEDTSRREGFSLSGLVVGEADAPLTDVTIHNLSSGKGAYTRPNGIFMLHNVNIGDKIRVSYVGYSDSLFVVRSDREVNIRLRIETIGLSAAVKVGYQVTSRRDNTSNVSVVKGAVLERTPVANPLAALQGRVPGLTVTATSGYNTAPWDVTLRGLSTIGGSNAPLYVLDGIPLNPLTLITDQGVVSEHTGYNQSGVAGPPGGYSPLFGLSASDIESIEVLKDAGATAQYGSRGGKGVIIINTKRGRPGKTRFEVSASSGFNFVPRKYPLLNSSEYVSMRKEAFKNANLEPDQSNAYDIMTWDTSRYTNWSRYFWSGTSNLTQADLSVSGGDKLTTFRVAGSYVNFKALNTYAGSDERITSQIAVDHKSLNRRLSVSFVNYFSFSKSSMISMAGSVVLPPNAPSVFDENGKLNWRGWYPISDYFPFGILLQPYTSKTTFINSQLGLQYRILQPLIFKVDFGYSQNFQDQLILYPIASMNPLSNPRGSSIVGASNSGRLIVEPQLEYKQFIANGEFAAQVGGSYQTVNQNGSNTRGEGFSNDNLLRSIANAPVQYGSSIGGEYKYAALFGRLTYTWNSKVLINLTGRTDGSSRFAAGRNIGNFYSVGLGYILSEESFMKKRLSLINFAKIRGSYGLTGSDRIPDYKYLTRWQALSNAPLYGGNVIYRSTQHANPYLKWQTDRILDAGIELSMFKDRVGIEASYYRRRSGNQLLDFTLPSQTGFQTVTANFPATVENKGLEFSISIVPFRRENSELKIFVNAGFNRNVLLKYPGLAQSPYAYAYIEGKPLKIQKLLKYTGVDRQTGQFTFEDLNKDGRLETNPVSPDNDLIVKDLSIRGDGGVGFDYRYKNVEGSLFFQFRIADGRNAYYTNGFPGEAVNIAKKVYDNRWRNPGDEAKFARLTVLPETSDLNFQQSDGIVSSANFMRLNSFELRYNLPGNTAKMLGMTGCKLFIRGANLLLLTNYEGSDPEIQAFGAMPVNSAVTFGAKLSF